MNFSTSSCIQEFKIWASGLGKESNDDKYEIELTWRVRSRADLNHSADWVSPTDPSKLTRDFKIFVDPVRGFIFLGSCLNRSKVWYLLVLVRSEISFSLVRDWLVFVHWSLIFSSPLITSAETIKQKLLFCTVQVQIFSVKQFEVCLKLICPHIFWLEKKLESLSKMTELRF